MSIDQSTITELRDGSVMSREEFHQAYLSHPDQTKFELIEGVVHMASPVSLIHVRTHKLLTVLGSTYEYGTPGVEFLMEPTVMVGNDHELRPDGVLRIIDSFFGNSHETSEHYLAGPPELIVEISNTSLNFDLQVKRRLYETVGVQEYLIIDVLHQQLNWFDFRADEEVRLESDDIFRSRRFPGFWLSMEALFREDASTTLSILEQGLASPEHSTFVEELAKRRSMGGA